ncbi:MAG TPA: hypothetical protein VHP35_02440 [Terriglobia bacterium]|nr:hypothetical protein [Terriglobia bacterium]
MLRTKIGRPAVGTVVALSSWMILSSSIVALAEQRCDNRRNQWRFSPREGAYRPAAYFRAGRDKRFCRNKQDSQYRYYTRGGNYFRYQDSRRYREYDRWYRDGRERSDTTSALIIAGSTGAGAAVGAIAAGSKGAAIGAIAGGIGGLIYDRQTDNRR